jgi:SPP1 family phage portal protein
MFDVDANREILTKVKSNFERQYHVNMKMYMYYMGITDTGHDLSVSSNGSYDDIFIDEFNLDAEGAGNYNYVNDRYDHRINTNFIKKFVKEEVSYSVGNDLTYTSHKGDDKIIDLLRISTAHWKADHDATLAKNMLIYSNAYELYYIDKEAQFCSRVISPRHGIAYLDHCDNVIFFLHIFRKAYDTKQYIDIYTDSEIIHCNDVFTEINRTSHPFGCVPVGVAVLSEEGWLDSLYKDLKTLQDAYETNLSDISSEITEFRNAYLVLNNLDLQDSDLATMKKQGIMKTKGKDGSAVWLIKTINDTFIQNTLTTLEDKMFQISCHINSNEKMSSNTSSLALRARLISLEEKCKLNQKALANCVKTRLCMLLCYMNNLKGTNYDYRDIKIKFTPNIPSDDLTNSTVVTALGDKLSTETALSLFSFIDNPQNEVKKAQAEAKANSIGAGLLNPPQPPMTPQTMPDKPLMVAKP